MTKYTYNKKQKQLFAAFLKLKTEEEMANFCRDLMTEAEIEEFSSRFEVAKELYKGQSQRKVSAGTGVSIATVTRVNQWLLRGMNGYQTVLKRISNTMQHHSRINKLASSG